MVYTSEPASKHHLINIDPVKLNKQAKGSINIPNKSPFVSVNSEIKVIFPG